MTREQEWLRVQANVLVDTIERCGDAGWITDDLRAELATIESIRKVVDVYAAAGGFDAKGGKVEKSESLAGRLALPVERT